MPDQRRHRTSCQETPSLYSHPATKTCEMFTPTTKSPKVYSSVGLGINPDFWNPEPPSDTVYCYSRPLLTATRLRGNLFYRDATKIPLHFTVLLAWIKPTSALIYIKASCCQRGSNGPFTYLNKRHQIFETRFLHKFSTTLQLRAIQIKTYD